MRQFEFPYNFDKDLIYALHTLDPEGKSINCIYLPPYLKDYQTILRTAEQAEQLDLMTREEYEDHIKYINSFFSNKLQILLQKENELMPEELIRYYLSLGIKNFCVASLQQAKIIKNIDNSVSIVGSIAMQMTKEKIIKNMQEFMLYFSSFVLPFSASRSLSDLKNLPRNFNYILLINSLCSVKCNGKNHWNFDYKSDKDIHCPGKLNDGIGWNESAKIRPMDLGLFDQYISVYKIQDRGWPTKDIIRDYVLYTSDYSDLPGIIYNKNIYNSKTNCYMTFTDKKYLPCVIRQAQRIKYLKSKYEYIVLIDNDDTVSEITLEKNNIHYKKISQELFINNDVNRFRKTFNKFKIIDFLDQYEKICWLDADTILSKNIDYLFDELPLNYQFLGSIDNSLNLIEGGVFIISDKLDIYEFRKQLYQNQSICTTDEQFLNLYFKNYSNVCLSYKTLPHLHFTGYFKLFNYNIFPLIDDLFNKKSALEFNLYIDKHLQEVQDLITYWCDFIDLLDQVSE